MNRPSVYRTSKPVIDAEHQVESDRSISAVIINAVSDAESVDPVDFPPLHESVDPDAIDKLFGRHDNSMDANIILRFQINSWNVFVRSDGRIRVCDRTQPTEPEPVFESTTA